MLPVRHVSPLVGVRSFRSLLLLAAASLATVARVDAQGSDSCSSAPGSSQISGTGTFSVNSTGATTGSPVAGCGAIGTDVWFYWTATSSGSATIATCGGTSADSVIAVWADNNGGACPSGSALACNDDSCGAQSQLSLVVTAGTPYFIEIGTFAAGSGFSGTFTISLASPPANDDCSSPTSIAGVGLFPFDNTSATTGAQGQNEGACLAFGTMAIAHDVWFVWTAPSTGIATVETCAQSAVDTKMAAYDGSGCPVSPALACNDDTCSLQSRVQFACSAGSVYTLQVGTYPFANGGSGNINITVGPAQVKLSQIYGAGGNTQSPTTNDYIEIYNASTVPQPLGGWSVQYASAAGVFSSLNTTALPSITLGAHKFLLIQEAVGATVVPGQAPGLPAPEATGSIAMSATDFKVALVNSTTFLPTGTPTYASNPTLVDFVGAGTANWNDASAAGAAQNAANNAPAASTAHAIYRQNCGGTDTNLSSADWAVGFPDARNTASAASNGIAVIGTALPLTPRAGQSVRLTATPFRCATSDLVAGTTVTVDASLIGAGPVSMLDNGTGGDEVANDGLYTALVVVGGVVSGSYNLPVSVNDGSGNTGGGFLSLFVTPSSAPPNDNCSSATALAVPSSNVGTVQNATVETNPLASTAGAFTTGMGGRRGVWYTVVGTGNTLTASLCATVPTFDSVMIVMAGSCDGLTVIGVDDDTCASLGASQVAWCSQPGSTYFIWVAPFASGANSAVFTLDISDSGSACAGAFPVSSCTGTPGPFSEVEPGYGPHTNDGCDSTPNRFTDIPMPSSSGTILRGTSRGMIGNRDTDWYRFLATSSGPIALTIDTLGTNAQAQFVQLGASGGCPATALFNTLLFAARCPTGIQTGSGSVVAGTWYAIKVVGGVGVQVTPAATIFGGQMPGGTTYQYKITASVNAPPANDACANAIALAGTSVAGDTSTATNDGSSTCDPTGKDVWYTITNGAGAGTLSLDTCGAAFDTVISVYNGCGGGQLACNDDCGGSPCTGPGSCLSVSIGSGQTLKIRVSDKGAAGGAFTLNWSLVVPPPANDECATATVISGNGPFAYDNRSATPTSAITPFECAASGSRDIWYRWTSQGAGTVTIDTCTGGPAWDSVLAVYTGACPALTLVACNDDSCNLNSQVSFTAACTTTYTIRLAARGTTSGAQGTFNLSAPGFTDTDGDGTNDCLDGCPLDPTKIAPGQCGCGVPDVDTDGDGTADCIDGCPLDPAKIAPGACGCGIPDTDSDGDGTPDCNDGCPTDPHKTAPGTCGCGILDIDTDGNGTIDCNDDCSAAAAISGGGPFTFDNGAASAGAQGQSEAACNLGGTTGIQHDIWYAWTSPSTGLATLSLCGSTLVDSKLAVYAGSGCPSSPALACNDNFCGAQSQISFAVSAGSVYTIQLGTSPASSGGSGTFALTFPPSFTTGFETAGTSGNAYALTVFDDGAGPRLYAAGEFDGAGGASAAHVARWNGAAGTWSPLGLGVEGRIAAMTPFDEDGGGPQPARLFVAGALTSADGAPVANIARWNGSAWSALGAGTDDMIAALLVFDDDGGGPHLPALYAGGLFQSAGGTPAQSVARWTGNAWQSVGGGMDGPVISLAAFDTDGNGPNPPELYAGGFFTHAGGVPANGIARWNGSAWQAVSSGVSGSNSAAAVYSMAVFDEDGAGPNPPRLFVGGAFSVAGGVSANSIARWNGTSFSAVGGGMTATGTFPIVRALGVFNEGPGPRLYAAGSFSTAGGATAVPDPINTTPLLIAARWDGTNWTALGSGFAASSDSTGRALAFFDDDNDSVPSLFVAGQFSAIGTRPTAGVARWTGTSWLPFGTGQGLNGDVNAFASAGTLNAPLFVGGNFTTAGSARANRIAVWNDASSTWSAVGVGFNATVLALEVVGSNVFAGGDFTLTGTTPMKHVSRWDGTSWNALGSGADGSVMALKSFGSLVIAGGDFQIVGGVTANGIAGWNGASWTPLANGTDNIVRALEVFNDGSGTQLYAGGDFGRAGSVDAAGIARWNGVSWSALGGGLRGSVYDLTVFDDGSGARLYAAGDFDITGDGRVDGVARWNPSNQTWEIICSGFAGGHPTRVYALAAWTFGGTPTLAIGGDFQAGGGVSTPGIALWSGGTITALGAGTDDVVRALTSLPVTVGQALFLGGSFTLADHRPSARFARTN